MPAARPKKRKKLPRTEFVRIDEAAAVLGMPVPTFRRYVRLFTDNRPPHVGRSSPIRISRVELDLVVGEGWAALADYRRRMRSR
jgi:hypothetical protein